MSPKSSSTKSRRKHVHLSERMMDDLTLHAFERAHCAIGDACQLIECPSQQHVLAITVIANLIYATSEMLNKPDNTEAERATFTFENIRLAMERAEKE